MEVLLDVVCITLFELACVTTTPKEMFWRREYFSYTAMKKKNKTAECLQLYLSLSGVGNKQTRNQTNEKLKRKKEEKWDGEKKDKTRFYGTFVRRIYFDGNVRKSRRRIDDSNSQRE